MEVCCNHKKDIENLNKELKTCRSELKNLRQQLKNLQEFIKNTAKSIDNSLSNSCECAEKPTEKLSVKPIGFIRTGFSEKRGIPRQAALGGSLIGYVDIDSKFLTNPEHALDGLNHFSHAWVIFHFHNTDGKHVQTKVTPPRLNGEKIGVFSTRSPHRPNAIGLSLIKLVKIHKNRIEFSGVDMQDGTPVLDIKPFIPNYDTPEHDDIKIPHWINATNKELIVQFSEEALKRFNALDVTGNTMRNVTDLLKSDPRSIYLKNQLGDSTYKINYNNIEISVRFDDEHSTVSVINLNQLNT